MNGMWNWALFPTGTKAYSIGGGHWTKTERGWKWCTGSTFPTPGSGVVKVELPTADQRRTP